MVPCTPLSAIFHDAGATTIDFMSVDLKGAEMYPLLTIDYSKAFIKILVIALYGTLDSDIDSMLYKRAGMIRLNTSATAIPNCRLKSLNIRSAA